MDGIQSFILNEKLKNFKKIQIKKKKIFEYYDKKLNEISIKKPIFNKNNKSNNYIYSFYINKKYKEKFLNFMKTNKIECKTFYNILLSENSLLRSKIKNVLPNAIFHKGNLVCLPSDEKLKNTDLKKITKTVKKFFNLFY